MDVKAETAAVMYSYPYGYIGAAVNKKGLIGNPVDRSLVVDTTTFGSFAAADTGPQWPVLWSFANEYPDLTGFDTYKRRWGMTRLAGGALQSNELHDYGQVQHVPPYYQSSARVFMSSIDKGGRIAYVNRDYRWPQNSAGTYTIIDDAGQVLASSVVDGELHPDTYPHGTQIMACGFFKDGSPIHSKITSTTTPTPAWNVSAVLVHGGVTLQVYAANEMSSFLPAFVNIITGAEIALIHNGVVGSFQPVPLQHFLYDAKLKKLLLLPFIFVSGSDTKYLIDNKNRRILVDRRMEEKKIVAFSVGAQGDLVRIDYAMPSGTPTLTFSGFLALVENGLIAAYGTDGYTKLALGSSGVTVTKDAYKKQIEPVVKDGETYTFAGLAFSGNAQHLA